MQIKNKYIIITKAVKKIFPKIKHSYCYDKKNAINTISKIKKNQQAVVIYDITYDKKNKSGQKIKVKNHINKTGENPLINIHPIRFLDATKIYKRNKGSVITTSFGKNYNKIQTKTPYPSTELSNIAILCKKFIVDASIEGVLINCKENYQ